MSQAAGASFSLLLGLLKSRGAATGVKHVLAKQNLTNQYTCVAVPTCFFNMHSNRQLESPPPLNFSYRIFRHSALAPNFSFDPIFRKGDVGSLVHSRECREATAVSVTSYHPDLVAETGKCGSRRLNLRFLVL